MVIKIYKHRTLDEILHYKLFSLPLFTTTNQMSRKNTTQGYKIKQITQNMNKIFSVVSCFNSTKKIS